MAFTFLTVALLALLACPALTMPVMSPEPSMEPSLAPVASFSTAVPTAEPSLEPTPDMLSEPLEVTPAPKPGAACFPARARVLLQDGRLVSMAALRVGDRVLVAPGVFSTVILFTHFDASAKTQMVVVSTAHGRIAASPGHFVKVNGALRRAAEIVTGDVVEVFDGVRMREEVVQSVAMKVLDGLYNAQTAAGQILVADSEAGGFVLASTYTDAVDPAAARALEAPLRALLAALDAKRRFGFSFVKATAPVGLSNVALARALAVAVGFASVPAAMCGISAFPARS